MTTYRLAKEGKDCPIFRDSLVENVRDICKLAGKLNIFGALDAAESAFNGDVEMVKEKG